MIFIRIVVSLFDFIWMVNGRPLLLSDRKSRAEGVMDRQKIQRKEEGRLMVNDKQTDILNKDGKEANVQRAMQV